jgi:hypothetical protein
MSSDSSWNPHVSKCVLTLAPLLKSVADDTNGILGELLSDDSGMGVATVDADDGLNNTCAGVNEKPGIGICC